MRRYRAWIAAAILAGLCGVALEASGSYVTTATMFPIEKRLEQTIRARWGDDPYMFIDLPRGYYVDNFGVIFASELSLVPGPGLMAFRAPMTKKEIQAHKSAVLKRVPELTETLKGSLMDAAAALPGLPDSDHVAMAVTLYHFSWEDTTDVPSQIVVQGKKKDLMAARANPALREQAIEVKESD